MDAAELLLLALGAVGVAAVSRRMGWQTPLVLVLVGFAVSLVPGVPELEIDGELLLATVLPPLLYSAALGVSYVGFRALFHPIVQLGVGLVFVTAIVVALVARVVVPGLPMPVALVLGAIVAPPDAVSAASIGRKLGLPRPVMTVLSGESLINDAAALTFYKVALAGVFGASGSLLGVDWTSAAGTFALAVVAGVATGLALGWLVHMLRMRLDDPVVESVLGLIVPFAAYLLAEELHGSGVLAVVAAGLYLGHRGPQAGYATRLQERPLWSSLDLLLEAVVFALIGLQLRYVLSAVQESDRSNASLLAAAVAVLATVVLVRFAYVFGLELVRRAPRPSRSGLTRPERPPWSYQVVISWTGMRGVVTLAAAAALPVEVEGAPFTERGAVQFLAYAVTIGTLLLQGLTLPRLIRRLGVQDQDQPQRDAEEELHLQEKSTEAALARLDELVATLTPKIGEDKAKEWDERIRRPLLARTETMHQAIRADEEEQAERGRRRAQTFRRVRQQVIEVQRQVLMEERDKGHVDEEVVRAVLQELDHEEAAGASSWVTRF
ncbi:Na+/H+ antiporter [Modestobacter italicus]|uniref:Na+/H+ antiporter n=1 Tax=Modestobacter italicus (strain DSM 44449 / CECT 9708 / BC 501) TaxID=2732864 RepID=I4ES63_MODI5|nr:Na+/H+ antiporter [Modestobacter marinus]CCH86226.1 Na+/H+ antiporter [Modestobacter marinus]